VLVADLPVLAAVAVAAAMVLPVAQALVVLVNSTAAAAQPTVLKALAVVVADCGTSTTTLSLLGRASLLLSGLGQ
jgi:hypothetical protein